MRPLRFGIAASLATHALLLLVVSQWRFATPPSTTIPSEATVITLVDEPPPRVLPTPPPPTPAEPTPPSEPTPQPLQPLPLPRSPSPHEQPTPQRPTTVDAEPLDDVVEIPPSEPSSPPSDDRPAPLAIEGLRPSAPITSPQLSLDPQSFSPPASALTPSEPAPPQVTPLPDADRIQTPADAGFERDRRGRWIFKDPDPGAQWIAELHPDGRLTFKDRLVPQPKLSSLSMKVPGFKELAMKAQGKGFWHRRKRQLTERTQALRDRMAREFEKINLETQLARLDRDLSTIWHGSQPSSTRRQRLFERWDECEEGSSDDPSTRIQAGVRARAIIIAFIRKHLPASSAEAFTPAELEALNRLRASRARFDPY